MARLAHHQNQQTSSLQRFCHAANRCNLLPQVIHQALHCGSKCFQVSSFQRHSPSHHTQTAPSLPTGHRQSCHPLLSLSTCFSASIQSRPMFFFQQTSTQHHMHCLCASRHR